MIMEKDQNFLYIDEEHAEVGKHLSLMWGRQDFRPYMNNLLDVSVSGRAREFSATALLALMELSDQHRREFRI
jgi:hypothetical protein